MIYPNNYEQKIGFCEIRSLLKAHCLSPLGCEEVDKMAFSSEATIVNEWLLQVREFRQLLEKTDDFPLQYFFDVRKSVARIRLTGTHMEEQEVFDLRRSLDTIMRIVNFLNRNTGDVEHANFVYPALHRLASGVMTFPAIIRRIDSIIDKYGKIKDGASMKLSGIRHELLSTEGSISRTLYTILHAAQREGLVDKDAAPTMRDGRLVLPVAPGLKRRINGIVHDESATGKTVFIEPAEVVEANNKIRLLEAEQRREIVRILTAFSDEVRPHVKEILDSYQFLGQIDLIQAKAQLAEQFKAIEPQVEDYPHMDWIQAVHPLLALSLEKQQKRVIPLDIMLSEDKRVLIISGPNAGGKSVCLKTVGLLQYMLQCGLSIPIGERSKTGLFRNLMIDIGDEQSIEDDLSTYSSHLTNMKQMMRQADAHTLLLIDEFGGGTEPTIGGAIAEGVLWQFWKKKAWAVITTHYQNLKHFAEDHDGVANGAMLYDRHNMQALFQLEIGRPGSSFAIEIARKTGISEEVISYAANIVGNDYIQSDKYLQDIVRDKRYWEQKRQAVHQREKDLERTLTNYEQEVAELRQSRKDILSKAKEEANELLKESNRRIEHAIREIRESQAEKEEAKRIREELNHFKQDVETIDTQANDELIEKKIRQIQQRKERKEKRKKEKSEKLRQQNQQQPTTTPPVSQTQLKKGDSVRIKGLTTIGKIESFDGKMVSVIFGGMRTKMRLERLERADQPTLPQKTQPAGVTSVSQSTREAIDNRKLHFRQDLDVRGMRGEEAINAVTYFIDDAILVGMARVRILHGTGTGILRQLIRQYLRTIPNVSHFADEHVQFGGAGITVVDLE